MPRLPPAAAVLDQNEAQRGVLLEHCQEPARGPVVRGVQVEVGEPRARKAAAAIAVVCGDGRLHSRTRAARRVSTSGRAWQVSGDEDRPSPCCLVLLD